MPTSLNGHILIVDDDPQVRKLLRRCFEPEGFRVSEAATGEEVLGKSLDDVALVTLDLNLNGEDGLDVAREIRARSDVPIVMVTGKGDTIDRVVGLELGADDYIAKPFHVREVLARVKSVIRRTAALRTETKPAESGGQARFAFDRWIVDFDRMELRRDSGELCDLTSGEMRLLEVFVTRPNRVLSRDQLMDLLKGHDWAPSDRSIDNQIARLRKKIEADPNNPDLIKTVRGAGYKFTGTVQPAA
ncbi:MAG: DNA-binding response regulator [Rhodospirillales bacterium CG15_BIG_FIL_POST_REV_8_21_14_020_66_15]|nr:MAG: DNA-binding response regulator [Rhodospirillales bacterium CG15_BIG_FIL_POST_REV_8_21_14_020_66_15]